MKKFTTITSIILISSIYLKAQTVLDTANTVYRDIDPIYILEKVNEPPTFHEFIILHLGDDKSFSILSREETEQKYGLKNLKYGSRVISVKGGVNPLTIAEILNLYHINKKDESLPVYVDAWGFKKVNTVVIVKKEIISVQVLSDQEKGRYIQINTIIGQRVKNEWSKGYKHTPIIDN